MGIIRGRGNDFDTGVFTEHQTKEILKRAGVAIIGNTVHDFTVLCPYHGNRNTPSMTVSKTNGKFHCFNEACGKSGTLVDLIMQTSQKTFYEAYRMVLDAAPDPVDIEAELKKMLDPEPDFKLFSQVTLDRLHAELPGSPGQRYMNADRGFTLDTLNYFQVGWSAKQGMVIVPYHTPTGEPMGFIGRAIEGKSFKNSPGLQKSRALFNFHRAKKFGDSVIITEAAFDAMKVHQAGFGNVVALAGSSLSDDQAYLLRRTFNRIIVMVDNDDPKDYTRANCVLCKRSGIKCVGHPPGDAIRRTFARTLPDMDMWYASYSDTEIYPDGLKDAGEMDEDQITKCVQNAMPSYEFALNHSNDRSRLVV
jgi:DNA primase